MGYGVCVRYFNTAGPCVPELHYMLPAAARLPEALPLIEGWQYFIVHAPRQTGKTTTLAALAAQLTAEGKHVALLLSCESGQVADDDYGAAEAQVLAAIRQEARRLPAEFMPPDPWPDAPPGSRIFAALRDWAAACPLPLVLFFDEIDALHGQSLISVLGAGFEGLIRAEPQRFLLPDGRLDFRLLVEKFAAFWIADGETLAETRYYSEAAAQLVFTAFLQRVVNGGGFVDREYGIGRGRIDLLVRKPYGDGLVQREAVELKVWHPRQADPLGKGLAQLDGYLDPLGLDTGTLIIFDRRPDAAPVTERTAITQVDSHAGRTISLLRA